MKIEGTVVESGNEIIEISGLSRDDIKALPNLLFKRVAINFDAV